MLKILNEHYYLDLDEIDSYINIENPTGGTENTISVVKYEMVKTLIEILMTENEGVDETLGPKSSELSIPFKISFNTLMHKKLLKNEIYKWYFFDTLPQITISIIIALTTSYFVQKILSYYSWIFGFLIHLFLDHKF
jgi:hypothetical protein